MEDLIIIGAGPIGIYGATLASLHNLKGKIIEATATLGGQLSLLYPQKQIVDLPGFTSLSAQEFINNEIAQYQSHDNKLELLLNESVISFEKKEDIIEVTTSKNTYQTKCLLICSGMGLFTPRKIGLPNEDKIQQIIYKIDDVNQMKGKEVTILGGGDSAVDYALLLKDIAQKVNIVHRRNDFRAQSNSVTQMENSSSINIKLNKNILSANTKEDKVLLEIEDNVTKNKEIITSDYVFVQYGQQASKDEFNIEKNNNLIVVNTYYMTSMENVFACGNIITYPGKVKNITSGLGEVATAIIKIDQIINPNKNIPVHF